MLKPETGPSRVHDEKIVNKLKLIAVRRKELKIQLSYKMYVLYYKCFIL